MSRYSCLNCGAKWDGMPLDHTCKPGHMAMPEAVEKIAALIQERDELRECLRLAWESACAAERAEGGFYGPIDIAVPARIRKALGEA